MDTSAFEEAAGRLMEAPLSGFVAKRKALASELRTAGDAETAARVLKIRKAPAPLWTANLVARKDPEAIEVLARAATDLEAVQAAALSGKSGSAAEMRSASAAFQQALDRMLKRASRMGEKSLESESSRRPVRDLLAAASLGSPETRAALAEGHLLEEPPPLGFGVVAPTGQGATAAAPAAKRSKRAEVDVVKRARALDQALQRAKRADEDATRAETHASRLEAEAERAETDARRLRREADAARSRAAGKLEQAQKLAGEVRNT